MVVDEFSSFQPRQKLRQLHRGYAQLAKERLTAGAGLPQWLHKILPSTVEILGKHHGSTPPQIVLEYVQKAQMSQDENYGDDDWKESSKQYDRKAKADQTAKLREQLRKCEWVHCGRGTCTHWEWLGKLPHAYCQGCACRWPVPVLEKAYELGASMRGYKPPSKGASKSSSKGVSVASGKPMSGKSESKGGKSKGKGVSLSSADSSKGKGKDKGNGAKDNSHASMGAAGSFDPDRNGGRGVPWSKSGKGKGSNGAGASQQDPSADELKQ
jgi:hypothetical protein